MRSIYVGWRRKRERGGRDGPWEQGGEARRRVSPPASRSVSSLVFLCFCYRFQWLVLAVASLPFVPVASCRFPFLSSFQSPQRFLMNSLSCSLVLQRLTGWELPWWNDGIVLRKANQDRVLSRVHFFEAKSAYQRQRIPRGECRSK